MSNGRIEPGKQSNQFNFADLQSRLIIIFTAVASLFLIDIAPGLGANWHDYTSVKYHFSIKMPADVKEEKRGKNTVFASQSDGNSYLVEISSDEFSAGDTEAHRAALIDERWTTWSQKLLDDVGSADDVTGNGWQGKIYSGTKGKDKVYGVLAFGKSRAYIAEAIGSPDHEDRTRFVDSLVVKDDVSDSQPGNNSSDNSSSVSNSSSSAAGNSSSSSDNPSSSSSSDGWSEFESKKYFFKVLMPGSVEKMPNPKIHECPLFRSRQDGCGYVVTVVPNSEHGFDRVWSDYQATGPNISDVKDISGSGWTGKSYIVHKDGLSLPTMMAGAKDGFSYVLEVSTAQGKVDKFFNSLKTTPADPMAEDRIAYEHLQKDWKEKATTPGFIVGAIVLGLFLLLVCAGAIVLTVILIRRNNKQPKM
jgi:hypothetical protein